MTRATGLSPVQLLRSDAGDFAINEAITEAAYHEWQEEVAAALPTGKDKTFGIGPIAVLLSKIAGEA